MRPLVVIVAKPGTDFSIDVSKALEGVEIHIIFMQMFLNKLKASAVIVAALTIVIVCTGTSRSHAAITTGVFFYGHETSAFVPCGTNRVWWVDGANPGMTALLDAYEASGVGKYGNLYVTLRGTFHKLNGNSDYVGIFEVEELVDQSVDEKKILECVPKISEISE